jgi:hypothetical protein
VQGEEAEEGQKSPGTAELLKDQLSDDEEEYQVRGWVGAGVRGVGGGVEGLQECQVEG